MSISWTSSEASNLRTIMYPDANNFGLGTYYKTYYFITERKPVQIHTYKILYYVLKVITAFEGIFYFILGISLL